MIKLLETSNTEKRQSVFLYSNHAVGSQFFYRRDIMKKIFIDRVPGVETNTKYQRQLAESLIRSVGVKEAFYFALQNQWMGVLAHLPSVTPIRTLGGNTTISGRGL